jgi:hypothetical protein
MRLLVIFAIATLSGCFFLAEDPHADTRGGKHTLTINWTLKQPGGAPATCPAGFQHLLLSSTTEELSGQDQTLVPCATSGTQTVELWTSGEYYFQAEGEDAWRVYSYSPNYFEIIYITDPTGFVVRAQSLPMHLKVDRDMSIDVEVYPDAGFLLESWGLRSGITGSRVFTCEAVGVDQIELRYRLFMPEGTPPAPEKSVRWPCNERHEPYYISDEGVGQGFTPALAADDYEGSLIAYRGGVEVGRDDTIGFNIKTGGGLTEWEDEITVKDR